MPNAINYATQFDRVLEQKYAKELLSGLMGTTPARFLNGNTIKIPRLNLAGYKDHSRQGGWNRQSVLNDWETKTLVHDRDVEFFVDAMDVDETNQAASAANITNTFVSEFAIPEIDKYRFSKLYTEYADTYAKTPDTTALTQENVLDVFDTMYMQMDEAEVPVDGRVLYVTPQVYTLLKSAAQVQRQIGVASASNAIDRRVILLDNVQVVQVPGGRMMSAYDFADGAVPAAGAKQIRMMLMHPSAVVSPIKHSAIYLHAPGTHTQGDGWLYQNRMYMDLFLLERKVDGVKINAQA